MTNPDGPHADDQAPTTGTAPDAAGSGPTRPTQPTRAPQGNAPSWVDEVLYDGPAARPTLTKTPPAEGDLRLPEGPRPPRPDGWAAGATASAERPGVHPGPPAGGFERRDEPQRPPAWPPAPAGPDSGDVAQKRLIAGLLAILLGSLGVHKFYLGLNTQGAVILGVNVGGWILALLLGLITLGIGLIITVPLAGLVSALLGLLGLIEGILYLTKTDADFQREYLVGKKPWL